MLTPVPSTDCTRAREAASARLDGELSEHELARLEAHLADCSECSEYTQLIAATSARLRAAELLLPDGPILVPRVRRLRVMPVVAAAALVAGVAASSFALGGAIGSRGPQDRPAATTSQLTSTDGSLAQLPIVRSSELPVQMIGKVVAV